jgi:hypothetical protein
MTTTRIENQSSASWWTVVELLISSTISAGAAFALLDHVPRLYRATELNGLDNLFLGFMCLTVLPVHLILRSALRRPATRLRAMYAVWAVTAAVICFALGTGGLAVLLILELLIAALIRGSRLLPSE